MDVLKYFLVLSLAVMLLFFACEISPAEDKRRAPSYGADDVERPKSVSINEETKKKEASSGIVVKTDSASISRGKELFEENCSLCHEPHSTETMVGPGLKGVLKNPVLPISKKPATPENILSQIREPIGDMIPFTDFSEEDILNIIAYLNTLEEDTAGRSEGQ